MAPIQFNTPPFSSPDPSTSGLLPLTDASTGGPNPDAEPAEAADDENKKAADWVSDVETASTQDELDSVVEAYEESGSDYKTVADAIEKKQNEINEE